jgi:hypothetical protein
MYGKDKTEVAIREHMKKSKTSLRGLSSQAQIMCSSLVEWMGTREN